MVHENRDPVKQAILLANNIRNDNRIFASMIKMYWMLALRLTVLYEKYIPQVLNNTNNNILNFSCGNRYYDNAVNSDLFMPHRFIKGKRRPDLYWSGLNNIKHLQGFFDGIICEHVIEHIFPDEVMCIFSNFLNVLNIGGVLVVSFPDIRRVLCSNSCQGFSSSIVAANSVIYRYGHRFMYDKEIVCALLRSVGFKDVNVVAFNDVSLKQYIYFGREVESSYVIASKI